MSREGSTEVPMPGRLDTIVRRWTLRGTGGVAVGAVAVIALVGGATAATPKKDRALEDASFTIFGGGTVHLQAQSDSDGQNAKGVFQISFPADPGFNFKGEVTCLSVSGNRAVAGGRVTKGDRPVGSGFVQFMVDNGRPGDGVDRSNTGLLDAPPTVCPTFVEPVATVAQGDIVVRDAP
jgi:hypothetical protein